MRFPISRIWDETKESHGIAENVRRKEYSENEILSAGDEGRKDVQIVQIFVYSSVSVNWNQMVLFPTAYSSKQFLGGTRTIVTH